MPGRGVRETPRDDGVGLLVLRVAAPTVLARHAVADAAEGARRALAAKVVGVAGGRVELKFILAVQR